MTKKERIEELERRVAELESERHQHPAPVVPFWPTWDSLRCSWCGGITFAGHNCRAWWYPTTWTSGGTNTNSNTITSGYSQVLYSGAN